MSTTKKEGRGGGGSWAVGGLSLIYFVAAFEIVIMISPFAFFFYSVFNPILLGLNRFTATRWLTAFFLPHMIVPNTPLLLTIRVLGSILFGVGALLFLACAAQVYLGKLLKWGVAERGAYAVVRHPQYTGLIMAGLGLTILWPRFLTLMLLAVMIFLYYLLARDEERRLLGRFGETYREYRARTGMFVPLAGRTEGDFKRLRLLPSVLLPVALLAGAAGLGFGLRAYTVSRLPLTTVDGIDVLSVQPADASLVQPLLQALRRDPAADAMLQSLAPSADSRILAYVVPVDYVMQGMIADTGPEWKLFQDHQTLANITDYVLHPVGHLQGGHGGHAGMAMGEGALTSRRIIVLRIDGSRPLTSARSDFGINERRVPGFFADVHLHSWQVEQVQKLPPGTGWGDVPTPMF